MKDWMEACQEAVFDRNPKAWGEPQHASLDTAIGPPGQTVPRRGDMVVSRTRERLT